MAGEAKSISESVRRVISSSIYVNYKKADEDTAQVLGILTATVTREWKTARLHLRPARRISRKSRARDAAELSCEPEFMPGQLVGSYRIEGQLGFGGMGEVYLAEYTKLDRKVAIKFLPSYLEGDALARKRLIREAKAAARLDHPNICAVYEVNEEANRSFIVMQYVAGLTLQDSDLVPS